MKILWLVVDRSAKAMDLFGSFRQQVEKLAHVHVVTRELNERPIHFCKKVFLGEMSPDPILSVDFANSFDYIFTDAPYAFTTEDWKHITTPKGVTWGDNHGPLVNCYMRALLHSGFDHFFPAYEESCRTMLPFLYSKPVIWKPPSVNIGLFRPQGNKSIRFLQSGAINKNVYPLRWFVNKTFKREDWYECIERPEEMHGESVSRSPEEYAKKLSSAHFSLSSTSIFSYVVTKMLEIPACGTVLVSDLNNEMKKMGFVDGENMVEIKRGGDEFIENQIRRIVHMDDDEIWRISMNGYNLVTENHSDEVRAREFIETLETLL